MIKLSHIRHRPLRPTCRAALVALGAVGLVAALPAQASIFGSLSNFDAVNDTTKPAYGFEIEIEDASFDHTKIGSVFGLNRDFGFPGGPTYVVRYGKVEIIDLPTGVKVRYGGDMASGITTPTGIYSTPGESCWPGANAGWKANPCDHFGITTYGSPAKTKYSWLVEDGSNPGSLVPELVHIPAVGYVYTPPVYGPPPEPQLPPPVLVPAAVKPRIVAEAPPPEAPEAVQLWGEAFWVKSIKTSIKNPHDIDLGDLLRGPNGNPDLDAAEIEIEWEVFQKAPIEFGAPGPNEVKEVEVELGEADKSIIRRYEFYKYLGQTNAEDGEAICDGPKVPGHHCDTPFGDPGSGINDLGPYIGQQIAGFNAVQAIPEPGTWAMLLAGLAVVGRQVRRRVLRAQ